MIRELVVDAYGCEGDLNDAPLLIRTAKEAVQKVGAKLANEVSHQFQPHGLTICLVLQESHFIVSTWPEHKLAIVNIFLCNPSMDTKVVWEVFAKVLKPANTTFHQVVHNVPEMKVSSKKIVGKK